MNIVVNKPYHKLLEGDSPYIGGMKLAMRSLVREDLSRAFAAGIRLMGGVGTLKLSDGHVALYFEPTAEFDA